MKQQMRYLIRIARGFAYVSAPDGITMPFWDSVKAR